jgi:hypothetical protein
MSTVPKISLTDEERSQRSYLDAACETIWLRQRARVQLGLEADQESSKTGGTSNQSFFSQQIGRSSDNHHKNRYGFDCFDYTAVYDDSIWLNANSVLDSRGHRIVATQVCKDTQG